MVGQDSLHVPFFVVFLLSPSGGPVALPRCCVRYLCPLPPSRWHPHSPVLLTRRSGRWSGRVPPAFSEKGCDRTSLFSTPSRCSCFRSEVLLLSLGEEEEGAASGGTEEGGRGGRKREVVGARGPGTLRGNPGKEPLKKKTPGGAWCCLSVQTLGGPKVVREVLSGGPGGRAPGVLQGSGPRVAMRGEEVPRKDPPEEYFSKTSLLQSPPGHFRMGKRYARKSSLDLRGCTVGLLKVWNNKIDFFVFFEFQINFFALILF